MPLVLQRKSAARQLQQCPGMFSLRSTWMLYPREKRLVFLAHHDGHPRWWIESLFNQREYRIISQDINERKLWIKALVSKDEYQIVSTKLVDVHPLKYCIKVWTKSIRSSRSLDSWDSATASTKSHRSAKARHKWRAENARSSNFKMYVKGLVKTAADIRKMPSKASRTCYCQAGCVSQSLTSVPQQSRPTWLCVSQ